MCGLVLITHLTTLVAATQALIMPHNALQCYCGRVVLATDRLTHSMSNVT